MYRIDLPVAAIHVWLLNVSAAGETTAAVLSTDETARAERIRSEAARLRWTMVRAGLRTILSAYTGREPGELRFTYGVHGKPALLAAPGGPDLRFNVSHSRGLALIAVAAERDVGVDVEAIRQGRKVDALAQRILSPRERAAFAELPAGLRELAFYHAWSRKEAFVKARGDALWLVAQSFDVSVDPRRPARLLNTRPDAHEAARWMLADVDVGAAFVAALACAGPPCQVLVKRFNEQ